jgi:hypothetical protein
MNSTVKWVLGIFIGLWILGFIRVPFLEFTIFSLGAYPFTLRSLLILGLIIYLINFLPGTFRTIAIVILVLWLLSQVGFLFFAGLGNILLLLIIFVVIFSLMH